MSLPPTSTPVRRRPSGNFSHLNNNNNNNKNANSDDLTHSLGQLSLGGSPNTSPAKSPAKTPLSRSSTAMSNSRRSSSAGTPKLLRKASLNSLHSTTAASPSGSGANNKSLTRRASSTNLHLRSTPSSPSLRASFGAVAEEQKQPKPEPVTTATVAHSYFEAELALHAEASFVPAAAAETLVVLQDNCYGHRFSRPRTSRANLSTIVERPERLRACVLGVSVAYVRLGERHAEGAHMPHPKTDVTTLPSVPFRIHKTNRTVSLLSPAVTNVHGTKWMEELKMLCDAAEAKLAHNGKELQRPDMDRGAPHHSAAPAKLHEGDLYLCSESLAALEGALGGVCEAVDQVFAADGPKRAFVGIRPPGHHCSNGWPSGFCWINNVHIGIMHAILEHGLHHAAIVDFDLHHGDGSQAIAWEHNTRSHQAGSKAAAWKKTSIGYFSLHDINSFPCEMGDEEKVKNASLCIENAHGQTMWNVHLEPWKTEREFWDLYESKYTLLLEKLRRFLRQQSSKGKGAIFVSAGFDASEWETSSMQRHKVNVPTDFYARFTRDVVRVAEEDGLSVDGRVISLMEGGYSDRAIFSGVLSHVSGLAGSDPVTSDEAYRGLGFEMGGRRQEGERKEEREKREEEEGKEEGKKNDTKPYDPAWWTAEELDRIEAQLVAPPPLPVEPPKPTVTPTYWSPTQSSQAKVVTTPKTRRTVSGLSTASPTTMSPVVVVPRPPTPPPPEIPWTVAFHELSKILIPSDRTTKSCTVEDLSAEATRIRRDRQSLLSGQPIPTPAAPKVPTAPTRMSMRERKPVKPYWSVSEEEERERKNRRRTVAGTAVRGGGSGNTRRTARRLSGASTTTVSESTESMASSRVPSRAPSSQSHHGPVEAVPAVPAVPKLTIKKTRPTAHRATSTSAMTPQAKTSQTKTTETPRKTSSTGNNSDMDKLTSGMRKIKIHVVTAEQREARAKAREAAAAAEAEAAAERAEKTAEAETATTTTETPETTLQTDTPTTPQKMPPPQITETPATTTDSDTVRTPGSLTEAVMTEATIPEMAPETPLLSSVVSPSEETKETKETSTVFIPYQPDGAPPKTLPTTTQPLQWMPPNETGTPAPTPMPMKRTELPVFTATSTIPFKK